MTYGEKVRHGERGKKQTRTSHDHRKVGMVNAKVNNITMTFKSGNDCFCLIIPDFDKSNNCI